MALVLEKKQIKNFLKELKEKFEVFDCRKAELSFKQYFLPAREEIFRYSIALPAQTGIQDKELDSRVKPENDTKNPENDTKNPGNDTKEDENDIMYLDSRVNPRFLGVMPENDTTIQVKDFVIFGANPVDLEAITQLDEIMAKPQPDFFYLQRREKAIIIGMTDEPIEAAPGGDIILEKINPEQYYVKYLTEKGKEIKSKFFKEVKVLNSPLSRRMTEGARTAEPERAEKSKLTKFQKMLIDSELLAEAVAWSINHKIWDELAGKCLGCGICSYVCPLCYCFSIEDRVGLDEKHCSRCRYWDACVLPNFSKIAGGHSFRKTLKQRYYNWFYHKFVRAYKEYGKAQCVGCGRCQRQCPAGIDIEKALERIVKDYKSR